MAIGCNAQENTFKLFNASKKFPVGSLIGGHMPQCLIAGDATAHADARATT
jgi:hypothetical protein